MNAENSWRLKAEVEEFLYREARYADEFLLDKWEALLTDDFHYWVPAGRIEGDPSKQLAYLNDNRARVATRIRQLQTGKRLSQLPTSPMRRILSNIEVHQESGDQLSVKANFVIYELAAQSSSELRVWPGQAQYQLRRLHGELRMAAKWIELVTARSGQRNLTFLI
ncbi:MAG: aromatic-ring-hydroxylating dioxygenase subunit beta [Actinomycetota bacterium]|nr:aromatic-ring-hydroxylating dioxygenase subunit beta [Actinomycetota bacterium]MEC9473748.1 aromatic-ring-hydroxylating dioxygenase subunit beta [Actinomycetota bacterium]MEE3256470.1 aromatic-ring-hydroxylating dioxygenase subunit beta [Actinomycetota bacterium]